MSMSPIENHQEDKDAARPGLIVTPFRLWTPAVSSDMILLLLRDMHARTMK